MAVRGGRPGHRRHALRPRHHRRAKILATLGPSSSTQERIGRLFDAGADAFRLNFSHGTHADHAERYRNVRAVETASGRPIAVMVDLQGPKLRVGRFQQGRVELREGVPFRFDLDEAPGDERRVALPHPEIFRAAVPDTELLLDDGRLRLCVTNVAAQSGAQEVAALVVSRAEAESLADAARERLSAFKVPTLWLVVPDADRVPMTATGKVDKSALEQLLRERGVRCAART